MALNRYEQDSGVAQARPRTGGGVELGGCHGGAPQEVPALRVPRAPVQVGGNRRQ